MVNFNDEYQKLLIAASNAETKFNLKKIQIMHELFRELVWQEEKNSNREKELIMFGNFVLKNRFEKLKDFNTELYINFWNGNVECDRVWDADLQNFKVENTKIINE